MKQALALDINQFYFFAASSQSQPRVSSQALLQSQPSPAGPSNSISLWQEHRRLFGFQASMTSQKRQLKPNKDGLGKRTKKEPTITRKFFCLANRDARKIPSPGENITLKKASLGEKKITMKLSANCQAVDTIIKSNFQKLQMAGGYTLCTSNVTRHFEPINPPYSAKRLKEFTAQGKIFIVPLQRDLDFAPAEVQDSEKVINVIQLH